MKHTYMGATQLGKEMKKFAERKYLSQKGLVQYHEDDSWPFLHINDPAILARFFSLLKQEVCKTNRYGWVYCRGQSSHHKSMLPSIFRGENQKYPVATLLGAQKSLMEEIKNSFKAKRFQNENLPALLQHYGLKTSWLDLVDNLFVAIWFATKSVESGKKKGELIINNSKEKYGWIYFVTNVALPNLELTSVDLRTFHHSLSVRPQVQHGISVTSKSESWNDNNKDLKDFVIATVRFDVSDKWSLSGYLASPEYFFPNSSTDNTLKYFKKAKLLAAISNIEKKYDLSDSSLGFVNWLT